LGLFDIFTGDAAKKAAEENRVNLTDLLDKGTGIYNTGQTNALGALDSAAGAYTPLSQLGQKYSGASDMLLNALGVNGPGGNAAATAAFQNSPGYQYTVDQTLDNANRAASAGGMLASGNTLAALQDRAKNLANQDYGQWLTNLGSFTNPALAATSGAATGVAGANTNKANVYGNVANSLVDLNKFTTNGINNQNTQQANAETAASGNLWNFGLNAAKMVAGL
jgi:hypothetical protein